MLDTNKNNNNGTAGAEGLTINDPIIEDCKRHWSVGICTDIVRKDHTLSEDPEGASKSTECFEKGLLNGETLSRDGKGAVLSMTDQEKGCGVGVTTRSGGVIVPQNKIDTVEECKTCNVKIGGGTPGHSSLNIWFEQLGGRLWLRKVKESKYLDFTLSNIFESDDVAEECTLERVGIMSEAVDIINEAALAGGNGLTLVRKIRGKHEQFAKLEGTDGTLCVYLFLTEKMVKLVRRKEEKTTHHTYKEALMSKSGPAMFIGRNAQRSDLRAGG